MKIIFWNINKNHLGTELEMLAQEIKPDILFLAETEMKVGDILSSLNKNASLYFYNLDPIWFFPTQEIKYH